MIKAEELTKLFGEKRAIDNISLTIEKGSIYGLVGSNGSGKSTLLRLISGVYKPDGGSITVDGEAVFERPHIKSRISYLGDTPYFMPNATVKETAAFYSRIYPSFDYRLYNRLLEVFPIDYKAKISSMSKGMQRQAALISAIAVSPDYLLLDEAFDGLDTVIRRVLKGILADGVLERKMTTVIASHNLRELEDLCDGVALVHGGKLLASGTSEELCGSIHKVQAAFSGVPDISAFKKLDVIKAERSGSLLQLVIRGDREEIMRHINRLSPVFAECIEPTLEELFIYELEVAGYDVKSIIE